MALDRPHMKLGEALSLRSDLQARVEQLRARLKASALVQEGEVPPEDPAALLADFERAADDLELLVTRINRTNLATPLRDGRTLTEALSRRDSLARRWAVMRALADAAVERPQRYSPSEIRMLPTIDVGALRRRIDDLARERRELDAEIQATNWTSELM